MSGERAFGTDGIRGPAGEGWLTPGGAAAVGRAAGAVLGRTGARALLAHDGRRSGPGIEAALTAGLEQAGVRAISAGRITTPGLAGLVRGGDFVLGAMISASHNPARDNGIKLFAGSGSKLEDADQDSIEGLLAAAEVREPATPFPPTPIDPSLADAYRAHLLDQARGLRLEGCTVVMDCAHGGGSDFAPGCLEELGATVIALAASPDGDNINAGCGSTHPEALQAEVRARGADVGVALDGDGDRCVLVDERGELVDGDGILTVVARHAAERGEYADPRVVATVMSNRGLHRALREVGVGVVEVPVGDRAVVEALRTEGLPLGGEQSGHVIFGADNDFTGDGLVTALRVLAVLRDTGRPLSELAAPYRPYPQVLLNVPVPRKPALDGLTGVGAAVRAVEERLGADGRVLLRYSGTEDLARVMVEGPDERSIRADAEALAQRLLEEIGA